MYVCCCALWLLFATMIWLFFFFVPLYTNHIGFHFHVCVRCGALWLLFAAIMCFFVFFGSYTTHLSVLYFHVGIVVVSGCCLPP